MEEDVLSLLDALLEKCAIFRVNTEILVVCDTDETFIELVKIQKQLIQVVGTGEYWERIILRSDLGEKQTTFYPPNPNPSNWAKPNLLLMRILNFNGDLCRWVQAIDCQIIS